MDRRRFLAGLGSLAATATLPVQGKEAGVDSIFANRGRYERLSLDYVHLRIGLSKAFSALHISDTHLAAAYPQEPEGRQKLKKAAMRVFGGRQEEALRDSLAWARDNADYVIHTGDLIDYPSEANYDLVRKYFGANVLGSVGNHEFAPDAWPDPSPNPNEAFVGQRRKALSRAYPFNVEFQATVANGVNFVTLDDVYGTVTERQAAMFEAEAKKGLPIILCMHVPIYSDEIAIASYKYWMRGDWKTPSLKFTSASVPEPNKTRRAQMEDSVTREFVAALRSERLLKAILVGHEHFSMRDVFSPTACQYIVGGNFMFHGREFLFS